MRANASILVLCSMILGSALLAAGCEGIVGSLPAGRPGADTSEPEVSVDGGAVTEVADGSVLETPPDASAPPSTCDEGVCVGESWVPRLTSLEYHNVLLHVLDVWLSESALPADGSVASRFWSNDGERLQAEAVAQYASVAEQVSNIVVLDSYTEGPRSGRRRLDVFLEPIPECATRNAACARAVIAYYGTRLYRRPLEPEEQASYESLYAWATTRATDADYVTGGSGTFADGIRLILEQMLQSPGLLYRVERGTPTADPMVVALTSREMAARLAAFLWRSAPDEALIQAADRDELMTAEQVGAQARRMLDEERANTWFWMWFAEEWMSTANVESAGIEMEVPEGAQWSRTVQRALQYDVHQFVDHIARDPATGDLHTLLTSSGGNYQNPAASWIFGATGEPGTWAESIPHRHGLLTLPGVLVANGRSDWVAPLFRGLFVRNALLCQELPGPPPELLATIGDIVDMTHGTTGRERLAAVTEVPGTPCLTCHTLTNHVGYAFSAFDDFGRYREVETGTDGRDYPIDQSGELTGDSSATRTDIDGPFANGTELLDRLAESETVARCVARQMSRFALMREPQQRDEPSVHAAFSSFDAGGRRLVDLAAALVTTDAFRHRRLPAAPPTEP